MFAVAGAGDRIEPVAEWASSDRLRIRRRRRRSDTETLSDLLSLLPAVFENLTVKFPDCAIPETLQVVDRPAIEVGQLATLAPVLVPHASVIGVVPLPHVAVRSRQRCRVRARRSRPRRRSHDT
ncbi:MAG: hypothetical protein IPG84_15090 [Betaproteobacteria bacterium]|nr:hypothetical protein [Betaproteobacteria bacterium]